MLDPVTTGNAVFGALAAALAMLPLIGVAYVVTEWLERRKTRRPLRTRRTRR